MKFRPYSINSLSILISAGMLLNQQAYAEALKCSEALARNDKIAKQRKANGDDLPKLSLNCVMDLPDAKYNAIRDKVVNMDIEYYLSNSNNSLRRKLNARLHEETRTVERRQVEVAPRIEYRQEAPRTIIVEAPKPKEEDHTVRNVLLGVGGTAALIFGGKALLNSGKKAGVAEAEAKAASENAARAEGYRAGQQAAARSAPPVDAALKGVQQTVNVPQGALPGVSGEVKIAGAMNPSQLPAGAVTINIGDQMYAQHWNAQTRLMEMYLVTSMIRDIAFFPHAYGYYHPWGGFSPAYGYGPGNVINYNTTVIGDTTPRMASYSSSEMSSYMTNTQIRNVSIINNSAVTANNAANTGLGGGRGIGGGAYQNNSAVNGSAGGRAMAVDNRAVNNSAVNARIVETAAPAEQPGFFNNFFKSDDPVPSSGGGGGLFGGGNSVRNNSPATTYDPPSYDPPSYNGGGTSNSGL